ncbi:MAG: protein phosphatase 2C domain-containing protein [Spirosomataceae bacterium]
MAIIIDQPLGFSLQGQRDNNEDAVYPPPAEATAQHRFFIVCDGVGGAQKGELASHLAVTGFAEYFTQFPALHYSEEVMKAAFAAVLEKFDALLQEQFLLRGMATTLTFVGLGEKEVTAAHIGDSRIYHIRAGKIIFKSEDHSKVNYLLKTGLITPEQALNHPERNVITRAIQGSHKETEMEVNRLTDIEPGDYFFQCTDGVLENLTDEALTEILESDQTNDKKLRLILNLCEGNTRDNYSGYLVRIAAVKESPLLEEAAEPVPMTTSKESEVSYEVPIPTVGAPLAETAKSGRGFWFLGVLVLIAGLAAGAYRLLNNRQTKPRAAEAMPPPSAVPQDAAALPDDIKKRPVTSPEPKRAFAKTRKAVTSADTFLTPVPASVTANTISFSKKKNQDTVQKKVPGG